MTLQTIDDVNNYMQDGYSRYGNQNKFLASDEYRKMFPLINEILINHNNNQHKIKIEQAEQAMKETNSKYGDYVSYGVVGMFMNLTIIKGTIVKRNDLPVVRLDEKFNGKRFVNWNVQWQKVNS